MKVFVISLLTSEDRRQSVRDQLGHVGQNFQFIDAVDGRTSSHPLLDRYDEKKFMVHYGRPANKGELGCYASHFLAWQKCADLGEPILVMEDDFVLLSGFKDAIQLGQEIIDDYGYIRFQTTNRSKAVPVKDFGGFRLVKYTKAPQSLNCYAITPKVAKRFIELSDSFCYPVDVFVRHFCFHKMPLYGLTPYVTHEGELAYESIIGKRVKVKKSLPIRLQRFFHKMKVMALTALENSKH